MSLDSFSDTPSGLYNKSATIPKNVAIRLDLLDMAL
jgi:hypothetical protein